MHCGREHIPDVDYKATIQMPSTEFTRICKCATLLHACSRCQGSCCTC